MQYERLNLTDGQVLKAEHIAHIEQGIEDAMKNAGGAAARLSSVTLLASNWTTEAESLHWQVVTIPGITKYSKVDLLPRPDQLAIFHNKDIAFVTENEDGVVTVFAIGDMPTSNYTIEVSITEVAV